MLRGHNGLKARLMGKLKFINGIRLLLISEVMNCKKKLLSLKPNSLN